MQTKLQRESCVVVKLPLSGGTIIRSKEFRKRARDRKIRDYFNGSKVSGNSLTSSTIEVSFDDIKVLKVPTKDDIADDSIRPVGKTSTLDPYRARPIPITSALQHALLAVSHADVESEVLSKNVAGFVHVQNVDMESKKLTLLSPQKGPLPGKFLLMGGIKWIDTGSSS